MRGKLEELKKAIDFRAKAEKDLTREEKILAECQKRVMSYEQRLQFLLDEEKKNIAGAGKVDEAQRKLEDCRRRDQLTAAIEKSARDVKQSEAAIKKIEGDISTQQKRLDRLKELSRLGRAALLASGLKEGEPCPVCGSTDHPKPAVSDELIPTDDEIERAEKSLRLIEQKKLSADKNLAASTAELELKRTELSRQAHLPTTARAQEELNAALQSKETLEDCRGRIEKGKKFVEDERRKRDEQQRRVTECASREAAAKRSVEEKQQTIMEGYSATDEARVFTDIDRLKVKLEEMTRAWNDADRKFHKLERESAAATERRQAIADRIKELSTPRATEFGKTPRGGSTVGGGVRRGHQAHDAIDGAVEGAQRSARKIIAADEGDGGARGRL